MQTELESFFFSFFFSSTREYLEMTLPGIGWPERYGCGRAASRDLGRERVSAAEHERSMKWNDEESRRPQTNATRAPSRQRPHSLAPDIVSMY